MHVRHGATPRTLAESEIAQRYRDRFQAATGDTDRLHQAAASGLGHPSAYLTSTEPGVRPTVTHSPGWLALAAVPAVRGRARRRRPRGGAA
ncbi:hypothetical protein [Streptomyces pratensis]|uniref:hypothetical protein n=1 Tax=Streptomyces pratensis TaxID=1169025 RepID=UPI0030199F82